MSDWFHAQYPEWGMPDAENPTVLGARSMLNGVGRYTLAFSDYGTFQIDRSDVGGWRGHAWRHRQNGEVMLDMGPDGTLKTSAQPTPQRAADELSMLVLRTWIFPGYIPPAERQAK